MRYQNGEVVRVAQVFQSGRTVTVQVLNLATNSLLSVTTGLAPESVVAGIYIWPSSDLVTPPSGYTEAAVIFTDGTSGLVKVTKVVLRGYVDSVDAAVSSRSTVSGIWSEPVPGSFSSGQAGNVLGNRLDTNVGSRASQSSLDALNDLSITDIQTALTNQGYTAARALLLDNLDATISSINTAIAALNDLSSQEVRDAMKLAPTAGSPAAGSVDQHLDDIIASLASLNDLSIVDVQTALTNQGYTVARALLLDNLDQSISSTETAILSAISALNDLAIIDVQTALTNQGYTTVRAALLDNLDQALSTTETTILAAITALNDISVVDITSHILAGSGETVDAALSRLDNIDSDASTVNTTLTALDDLIRGGRDIDFVGNDALGWQRVERNQAGAEVERYNLFDEGGARITGTVAAFISAQKMISSEVKL